MSRTRKDRVGIFWDFQNLGVADPSWVDGRSVVSRIRSIARRFGVINVFQAYVDVGSIAHLVEVRSELQTSGVSLVDCPRDGENNVIETMMLVDMMAFPMDCSTPVTLILVSSNHHFAYAISVLRMRHQDVVVISKDAHGVPLQHVASRIIDWERDVLGRDTSDSLSIQHGGSLNAAKGTEASNEFESSSASGRPDSYCDRVSTEHPDVVAERSNEAIMTMGPQDLPVNEETSKLQLTDEVEETDKLRDHVVNALSSDGLSLTTVEGSPEYPEPESTYAPSSIDVEMVETLSHPANAFDKEAVILMLKGDDDVQPSDPAFKSESQVQAASLYQESSPPSTSMAALGPETTALNGRQNNGALTAPGPMGSQLDHLHNANAGPTLLSIDWHYRPFVEFLDRRRMSGTSQLTWEQAKELFWNGAIRDEVCRTFANYVVRCSEAGLIDIAVEQDSNAAEGTKASIELRGPWHGVLSRTGSSSECMLSRTSRLVKTKTLAPTTPNPERESFKNEASSPVIGEYLGRGVTNTEDFNVVAHGLSPEPCQGDFFPRVAITMLSDNHPPSMLLDGVIDPAAPRPSTEEQTRAADSLSLSTDIKSAVSLNSNVGGSGEARTPSCDGPSTASHKATTSKEKQEHNEGEGIELGGGAPSPQPGSVTKSWSSIAPRYRPLVAYLERKRLSGAQEICFPQIAEEFWTGAMRSRVATDGRLKLYIEECHQVGIVARSFKVDPGNRHVKERKKYISLRGEWHGIFSGNMSESFNATDSNGQWSYPDVDLHLGEPVRIEKSFIHSRYLPLVEYLKHKRESGIVKVSWDEATKSFWTGVIREQIGGQFGRYVKDRSEAGFVDIIVYKKGTKKNKHKEKYIALRSFPDGAVSCPHGACPSSGVRVTDDKACNSKAAGVPVFSKVASAITDTEQESGPILDTRTLGSPQAIVTPMGDRSPVSIPPSLEQDYITNSSTAGRTQDNSDAATLPQSNHPTMPGSPAKSETALSDASSDSYQTATSSMIYEDRREESASAENNSTTGNKPSEVTNRSSSKSIHWSVSDLPEVNVPPTVTLDSPPSQDSVQRLSSAVEAGYAKPESAHQDRHGSSGPYPSSADTLLDRVASTQSIEHKKCNTPTEMSTGVERISQDASRNPTSSPPVSGKSGSRTTSPIVWVDGIVDLEDLPGELRPAPVPSSSSNSTTTPHNSLPSVPLEFRVLVVYLEKRCRMGVPQVRRCTINERVFRRNPQIAAGKTIKQYIARAIQLGFVTRSEMNGKKGQWFELGAKWRGLRLPEDEPSSSAYRSDQAATANTGPEKLEAPKDKLTQGTANTQVTTEDSASSHPTSALSSVASPPSKHSIVWSEGLEDLAELPLGYRPPSDIPMSVPPIKLSSVPLEYRPLVMFLEEKRRAGRPEVGWASVNKNVWVKPRQPPAGGKFQRYVERAAAKGLVNIRGMSEPKAARAIALREEWHGVSTT